MDKKIHNNDQIGIMNKAMTSGKGHINVLVSSPLFSMVKVTKIYVYILFVYLFVKFVFIYLLDSFKSLGVMKKISQ